MDFASAKATLQGSGVYDHVTDVLARILTTTTTTTAGPEDGALASFEAVSASIKAAAASTGPAPGAGAAEAARVAAAAASATRAAARDEALFAPAPPDADADADAVAAAVGSVQDFVADAGLLEWGGVVHGRVGAFKVHAALRQLAAAHPALRAVRYWGTLLGADGDYIVAEALADADESEPPAGARDGSGRAVQPTGEGPNRHTYFVAAAAGAPWARLPPVTPHALLAARRNRRLLTGRLDAPVRGHPPFPGDERLYARALIAAVSAEALLAPAGAFAEADGAELGSGALAGVPDAEWDAPDLKELTSWVHTELAINDQGRTAADPPADGEEEAPDAPPPSAALRPAADDAPVGSEDAAWSVRVLPATGPAPPAAAGGAVPAVVVLRSRRFPGAVVVGAGKRHAAAYVGYGLPAAPAPFQPALPPPLPAEYDFAAAGAAVNERADVAADPTPPAAPGDGDDGDAAVPADE